MHLIQLSKFSLYQFAVPAKVLSLLLVHRLPKQHWGFHLDLQTTEEISVLADPRVCAGLGAINHFQTRLPKR